MGYEGGATDGSGLLLPLSEAQRLLDKPGLVKAVFVSNTGGAESGAKLSGQVIDRMQPTLSQLGLEADNTKEDALNAADQAGATFMSIFTTFGSFSIAAGILLIFLIFVMLAAERRSELGIARAVGTRRGHLVQMFLFEGVAYDMVAAAVGVARRGRGRVRDGPRHGERVRDGVDDFDISYSVKPVKSRPGLHDRRPPHARGRRILRLACQPYEHRHCDPRPSRSAGREGTQAAVDPRDGGRRSRRLDRGFRSQRGRRGRAGARRLARHSELRPGTARSRGSGPGGAHRRRARLGDLVRLPISRWLFGDLKLNLSIFLLGGLMIVIGATWTIVYNADVLLGALASTLGRIRALAPILRMSIAYPLRSVFRTGVTLAMFTLVVFTLVVGAITTSSFLHAIDNVQAFGGGFDVRATASPASPIVDMPEALRSRARSRTSRLSRRVERLGSSGGREPGRHGANPETLLVHGADRAFLTNTTFNLAARASGYDSDAAVWQAVRDGRNLAVVDPFVVPRRANWGFGPMPAFHLTGFYLEDKAFAPFAYGAGSPDREGRHAPRRRGPFRHHARAYGRHLDFAVDARACVRRPRDSDHLLLRAAQGIDPDPTRSALESAFLANGMQADSLQKLLDDVVAGSLTFDRLIMGFMGLGLIVGVAALGVISARSVVERRQQIGVLRAIGFRKRMVQACFLLESSFIAVTSIFIGTLSASSSATTSSVTRAGPPVGKAWRSSFPGRLSHSCFSSFTQWPWPRPSCQPSAHRGYTRQKRCVTGRRHRS